MSFGLAPNQTSKPERKSLLKKLISQPSLIVYHTNYLLPLYYSSNIPVFGGIVPGNQGINKTEVKYQISIKVPIWENMLHIYNNPVSLYLAYTQSSYWQLYEKSAYFRATDYEPEMFVTYLLKNHKLIRLGINHESNGRGSVNERSWNRLFASFSIKYHQWIFSIKPWLLIFKKNNSDIYNPDIDKFLGHEQFTVGYIFSKNIKLKISVQNIERLKRYLTTRASLTLPFYKRVQLYFEFFHGYGQSMIEYNHKQTSFGVGFSVSRFE